MFARCLPGGGLAPQRWHSSAGTPFPSFDQDSVPAPRAAGADAAGADGHLGEGRPGGGGGSPFPPFDRDSVPWEEGESTGGGESADGVFGKSVPLELRGELLDAALADHVRLLGFGPEAVAAAAKDRGLSAATTGLFERGGAVELVERFIEQCNSRLGEDIGPEELQALRRLPVRDRIRSVVKARLRLLQPLLNHWPKAVGLLAQPQHLVASLGTATATVDAMWDLIDDPTDTAAGGWVDEGAGQQPDWSELQVRHT